MVKTTRTTQVLIDRWASGREMSTPSLAQAIRSLHFPPRYSRASVPLRYSLDNHSVPVHALLIISVLPNSHLWFLDLAVVLVPLRWCQYIQVAHRLYLWGKSQEEVLMNHNDEIPQSPQAHPQCSKSARRPRDFSAVSVLFRQWSAFHAALLGHWIVKLYLILPMDSASRNRAHCW